MKKFRRPLDVFNSEVLQCSYGHYPWDDWARDAVKAGVSQDLAWAGPPSAKPISTTGRTG
jgi:hypothetical protein